MTDYTVDDASDLIQSLRNRRRGQTREQVWSWIASRTGISPGTIETLARKRTKRLVEGVGKRLRDLAVRELEAEIERLNHELEMVRAGGGDRLSDARERVARALRTSAATLANLRNRNPKTVEPSLYARLQDAVLRELRKERERVEHQISLVEAAGLDPASREVRSLLASRERLSEALGLREEAA